MYNVPMFMVRGDDVSSVLTFARASPPPFSFECIFSPFLPLSVIFSFHFICSLFFSLFFFPFSFLLQGEMNVRCLLGLATVPCLLGIWESGFVGGAGPVNRFCLFCFKMRMVTGQAFARWGPAKLGQALFLDLQPAAAGPKCQPLRTHSQDSGTVSAASVYLALFSS